MSEGVAPMEEWPTPRKQLAEQRLAFTLGAVSR